MDRYAFGVDVGGTTVKMGFFTAEGELLGKWEIPTDISEYGVHIIPDIAQEIREKLAASGLSSEDVIGVGLGVPGPVDADGNILHCVNLGWGTFNLEAAMTRATGIPCKAGNDADVAALGEIYKGSASKYRTVVLLTLGTGVGGGIIIDGRILPGTFGAAGEIGHMNMKEDETDFCGCGHQGCLEQYASASGIVRMARLNMARTDVDTVLRQCKSVTSKDIFDAARDGDEFSRDLVEEVCKTLGLACARISTVVDPEAYIFGGGMSKAGNIITNTVEKYYNRYAFHIGAKFLLAKLGNDAGIWGAVKLVFDSF
ncbi:MAG: ROK family glucokinase [Clostridiales bacterium]|nr:ROK family glucokinase [Clostridiales bacterium]